MAPRVSGAGSIFGGRGGAVSRRTFSTQGAGRSLARGSTTLVAKEGVALSRRGSAGRATRARLTEEDFLGITEEGRGRRGLGAGGVCPEGTGVLRASGGRSYAAAPCVREAASTEVWG